MLALCWNVVLACFGTFPVLFPVTEEAFEPMFGQQVYQLSYARLCNTLQDISIRHPGRESWSGTQPQSSSQAPPPIETQVEAPGDAPRRPQMVPLAPVTTCKNSRLSQSLKTCTYIYIHTCPTSSNLKSVQNGSDSADVKNQMNCLSTCRTWNHHEPKEVDRVDQWAKVKSGQVRYR